ncbi:hypothetical protein ACFLS1_10890 [Verrucomicrobiota bacterium]
MDFGFPGKFNAFTIAGYRFEPVVDKQPKRRQQHSERLQYKDIRKHVVNARVFLPSSQPESILFKGRGSISKHKDKLIDDLLAIISILIRRNVRKKADMYKRDFPLCASNQLNGVAKNSDELCESLAIALQKIQDSEWQARYDNGFQIIELLHLSNTVNIELRFLAYMMIWEYLYYCHHKDRLTEKQINDKPLEQQISWLIREFGLIKKDYKEQVIKCQLFSQIRNQVAHGGKFRTKQLKGMLNGAQPALLYKYMNLFECMTENLVLSTIGINSLLEDWALKELMKKGKVYGYEEEVRFGL